MYYKTNINIRPVQCAFKKCHYILRSKVLSTKGRNARITGFEISQHD